MSQSCDLRQRIDSDLGDGRFGLARQHLSQMWRREPTMAVSSYVLGCRSRLLEGTPFTPFRLAILRSFTVEPVVTILRAGALVSGIDLEVHLSDFNAYAQAILDPSSSLYRFQPDAALLAVLARDLEPAGEGRSPGQAGERIAGRFGGYVAAFRARSQAPLVIQGLEEVPASPATGAGRVNERLRRLAEQQAGTYFLDYQALIARHGADTWNDERSWTAARQPLANRSLFPLANAWLGFVHPLAGRLCKVLVTDLDGTLWSGVVGEDGPTGVRCAPAGPGQAHHALQQAMLDLRGRGVLLAVCSQNDPAEALEVLEKHPDMLLRPSHFAAMRINWDSKADNLRSIAEELHVGSDSLAFLDDDPVQLERVRAELPEVHVIELPADEGRYGEALREDPFFARLRLSREDLDRPRYYDEQRSRERLLERAPSLEEFYRSLEQRVTIARLVPETAERAAQLTQKTSQFNLTGRRYSAPQLLDLAARVGWRAYTVRVVDRFGDNGLTGFVLVHEQDEISEIDTFLLSCRIIGRTVETAVLSFLLEGARRRRRRELRGSFLSTRRNGIVKDLFAAHAFATAGEREGRSLWSTEPAENRLACPDWILLQVEEGAFL